jgi:hypothetical protein
MEQKMRESVLTVTNYSETEEDGTYIKTRVTINPQMVEFIIAGTAAYVVKEGRELIKTNVVLSSGSNIELFISEIDLLTLERSVATYFLPE